MISKIKIKFHKISFIFIFLVIASTIIAGSMNFFVREWQYQKWQENSQIFYLDDGTPLFTTTDAPYFLGLAQAIKRDGDFNQFNELQHYPHIRNSGKESPQNSKLRDASLLSVILSMMASDSSAKSLPESRFTAFGSEAFVMGEAVCK